MSVSPVNTPKDVVINVGPEVKKVTSEKDSRISSAAQKSLNEQNKAKDLPRKSLCSRVWTVVTSPFVWIYNKIAGALNKIKTCWNAFSDSDEEDDISDNGKEVPVTSPKNNTPSIPAAETESDEEDDEEVESLKKPTPTTTEKPKNSAAPTTSTKESSIANTAERSNQAAMKRLKDDVVGLKTDIERVGKAVKAEDKPADLDDLEGFIRVKERLGKLEESRKKKSDELEGELKKLEALRVNTKPDDKASQEKKEVSEKAVEQFLADLDEVTKNLKERETELNEKLSAYKEKMVSLFNEKQKALTVTPENKKQKPLETDDNEDDDEEVCKEDPLKKLEQNLREYQKHFRNICKLGWEVDKSSNLTVLKTAKSIVKDLQGFPQLGNTCWMNAGLQGLLGLKNVREAIKAEIKKGEESESARKLRLEKNPQKPIESNEEFSLRIDNIAKMYPARLTEEVQKMLFDARKMLPENEGMTKPDPEESLEAFRKRQRKNCLQKNDLKLYLSAKVKKNEFEKTEHGYVLKPFPAETDIEFRERSKPQPESEDEFKQRKEVHAALKKVLEAWEDNADGIRDALYQLRQTFTNGINPELCLKEVGHQTTSDALVFAVVKTLGLGVDMIRTNKMTNDDQVTEDFCDKDFNFKVNLTEEAEKENDAAALIKMAFAESRNTDDTKWKDALDFTSSWKIAKIPSVMMFHFNRKTAKQIFNSLEVSRMKEAAKKEMVDKLTDERERAFNEAFDSLKKSNEIRVTRDLTLDGFEGDYHKGYMVDLTDELTESEKAQLDGKRLKVRIYGFTVHKGGISGGHYMAYRHCEDGLWRYYSDSTVSIVNEEELKKGFGRKGDYSYEHGWNQVYNAFGEVSIV